MENPKPTPTDHMREAMSILLTRVNWNNTAAGQAHWGRVFSMISKGIQMEENRKGN